ncbi:MAG: ribosome maturation factor RimM [Peptococcaceae bacterium]|nr:ribosome maturation factor RimM [Peptococcaceae bacterium]
MFITIGKIVNTHGIRGELRVQVFSDDPCRFESEKEIWAVSPLWAERSQEKAHRQQLTIETVRYHKGLTMLTFEEIPDLTAAEKLKGWSLQVEEADLPPLPEGRYYIYQLVGLEVWEGQVYYGKITEVLQPGSNDIYVVGPPEAQAKGEKPAGDLLVPALKTVVKKVDLPAGRMEVELPAGLLELYRQN